MKYKIGDRVRVCTTKWGQEQFGLIGVVTQTKWETPHFYGVLPVIVSFSEMSGSRFPTNGYNEGDLELVTKLKSGFGKFVRRIEADG